MEQNLTRSTSYLTYLQTEATYIFSITSNNNSQQRVVSLRSFYLYPLPLLSGTNQHTNATTSIMGDPIAEIRRSYDHVISATGPPHGKTTSLHRIRATDDISTIKRFSLQIEMQLMSLKINIVICNTLMEWMTGIILGVGTADGGRPNGIPHWPSPYLIWSLSRGVPIPRPKVTRCFWQVYNNAVKLTNWNTVKVIEDKQSSMQLNNEVFAQCF